MKKEEGNIISEWLEKNGDPLIEIKVLNEVIDSLLQQQERSYSEEEVIKIIYQFHYDLVNSNFDSKKEWFEQFKKKQDYEKL